MTHQIPDKRHIEVLMATDDGIMEQIEERLSGVLGGLQKSAVRGRNRSRNKRERALPRADRGPVPPNQIHARVSNRPQLFTRTDDGIRLADADRRPLVATNLRDIGQISRRLREGARRAANR
jgi:hypothetical protein